MLLLQANLPQQAVQLLWRLPRSKSLWARQLLLDELEGIRQPLPTDESLPDDLIALSEALDAFDRGDTTLDVLESGTAMRLLLAFLAVRTRQTVRLQGRGRQHQRPISPLVEALRQLGAKVDYLGEEGFPPLAIHPATIGAEEVTLDASASSQYLSALLLLAPQLSGCLAIDTRSYGIASRPYATMTQALLAQRGYRWVEAPAGYFSYLGQEAPELPAIQQVEGDWSAASYAYALLAFLPEGSTFLLPDLYLPSLQGDAEALQAIFSALGILTAPADEGVCLTKVAQASPRPFTYSMKDCPDLVPAVVVALLGLGIPFRLTGVAHLRLKESDRLLTLQTELAKLGYPIELEADALAWEGKRYDHPALPLLEPHGDHRIAMALALLALREGSLRLSTPEVVAKSFPRYWQELTQTRLFISQQS